MSIVSPELESVPTEDRMQRRWQDSVRQAIRCPHELLRRLRLDGQVALAQASAFPVFVPEEWLQRIEAGNPHDPLLRQVLPLRDEQIERPGYSADPLGEQSQTATPGLIRKYRSRALLVLTGACAVHCRYCFRREFPYSELRMPPHQWQPAIEAIRSDPQIHEVIYSGGDPLMLVDDALAALTRQVDKVSHLRALRIHTRLPVIIPQRIERSTLDWIAASRLPTTVVIHANHARELDEQVAAAVERLRSVGANVLNQAVLLHGVNDSVNALSELSWRLIQIGAIPYYLHQLDRVRGAAHFHVSTARGMALVSQLRDRLPGFAVPRYVVEEPGRGAKTVLL